MVRAFKHENSISYNQDPTVLKKKEERELKIVQITTKTSYVSTIYRNLMVLYIC